ncbi:LysE family translocator [Amycolatopsis anabasis]|uniref:LysE family translocator n=1 Tax=Amycolatopsis anabasis TaxID=1840409 RepID=UPI00131CA2E7|nr:LysE family translocator [Amycolatopsis anabasis]
MTWATYGSFLAFIALIVIAPGPDTMVVLKSALAGGTRGGLLACGGIATASSLQATVSALGLGAVIVHSQPVFQTLRWAGVAYLCYLGLQALRGAWRGDYRGPTGPGPRLSGWRCYRQGVLCNLTNPKVLALYLSVLPQFLDPVHGTPGDALILAYTVTVSGQVWLLLVLLAVRKVRGWLQQRKIRRAVDALTGTALLGFGAALATE